MLNLINVSYVLIFSTVFCFCSSELRETSASDNDQNTTGQCRSYRFVGAIEEVDIPDVAYNLDANRKIVGRLCYGDRCDGLDPNAIVHFGRMPLDNIIIWYEQNSPGQNDARAESLYDNPLDQRPENLFYRYTSLLQIPTTEECKAALGSATGGRVPSNMVYTTNDYFQDSGDATYYDYGRWRSRSVSAMCQLSSDDEPLISYHNMERSIENFMQIGLESRALGRKNMTTSYDGNQVIDESAVQFLATSEWLFLQPKYDFRNAPSVREISIKSYEAKDGWLNLYFGTSWDFGKYTLYVDITDCGQGFGIDYVLLAIPMGIQQYLAQNG